MRVNLQMGHIIACADAVIYIAHSMYLLRSDIDYFLEHLRADQIILVVMLTDDNANGSTTLFSLISLLQYLGGLENSKLTKNKFACVFLGNSCRYMYFINIAN